MWLNIGFWFGAMPKTDDLGNCPKIMCEGGIIVEAQWDVSAGSSNYFCRTTGKYTTFYECDGIEKVCMHRI